MRGIGPCTVIIEETLRAFIYPKARLIIKLLSLKTLLSFPLVKENTIIIYYYLCE